MKILIKAVMQWAASFAVAFLLSKVFFYTKAEMQIMAIVVMLLTRSIDKEVHDEIYNT